MEKSQAYRGQDSTRCPISLPLTHTYTMAIKSVRWLPGCGTQRYVLAALYRNCVEGITWFMEQQILRRHLFGPFTMENKKNLLCCLDFIIIEEGKIIQITYILV